MTIPPSSYKVTPLCSESSCSIYGCSDDVNIQLAYHAMFVAIRASRSEWGQGMGIEAWTIPFRSESINTATAIVAKASVAANIVAVNVEIAKTQQS